MTLRGWPIPRLASRKDCYGPLSAKTERQTALSQQGVVMPLSPFSTGARRVAELCDLLEALADDLPRKSKPVWKEAIRLSSTVLPEHIERMNCVLIPILAVRTRGDALCETMLKRLQTDYDDSRSNIIELTELLDHATRPAHGMSAEAVGFALRGHFESMRRQIGWDIDVVLPLAKQRLTQRDMRSITRADHLLDRDKSSVIVLAQKPERTGKAH